MFTGSMLDVLCKIKPNPFDSSHERTNTIKTYPQAPTTNTLPLPLTTHHTLIVCGVLRRVCLCDDDRDAKEDDCDELRNAMILVLRRQKPLTKALDG